MKLEDIKMSLTRYRIDDFMLMVPGFDDFPIEQKFISSIILEKDYDDYHFPFFQLEIGIPGYLYRAMKKQPHENRVHLNMKKGQYFEKDLKSPDTTMYLPFIDARFYVFFEDITPDSRESDLDKIDKDAGTYNKGYIYGDLSEIRILLYEEKAMTASRQIVNKILTSSNLLNAITLVCNKSGLGQVLMSIPQNNKSYSELCITPIPAIDQIERLCNGYGFHKKGSIVFIDFNKFYIIDKAVECTAYEKNEYKTTYICQFIHSGPESMIADGCYSNTKEKYNLLNMHEESFSVEDLSAINAQQFGNSFTIIDTKTGNVTSKNVDNPDTKDGSGASTRVLVMNQGDSTGDALSWSLNEATYSITCGFLYGDIDMLAPNKEFIMSLEEPSLQKYNKKYRVKKVSCIFVNEGPVWCPQIVAEFRG